MRGKANANGGKGSGTICTLLFLELHASHSINHVGSMETHNKRSTEMDFVLNRNRLLSSTSAR